jgi:ER membrane protein SH3
VSFFFFSNFNVPVCLFILTDPTSPVQYRHCCLRTIRTSQYVHCQWSSVLTRRSLTSRVLVLFTGIFTNYVALPPHHPGAKFPPDLRTPTLGLASSHLICSVALTGVLALQTGRWWAERADDDASAAEKLSASAGGSGEKEGSKSGSKKSSQGEGTAGPATTST